MFIQTEPTPNPATMKFLPGQVVMTEGTAYFASAEAAVARSPLADRLFAVDGVAGVFLGADFISITKEDGLEWHVLKPPVLGALMEHLSAGRPVLHPSEGEAPAGDEPDDEVVAQIKDLLDTRVRPTSFSTASRTGWSTCTCRAPARVARARRQRSRWAWRTCSSTTSRKSPGSSRSSETAPAA